MIAGRYALGRELGRGGMGVVWLGTDEVLGRPVALKRLAPSGGPASARAEREARLAARLSHPHLVAVYDLAVDGDDRWLVMEYVEGPTLASLVANRGPLSPDEVAPVLAQVADALATAHAAGIVHRDVKPSNILLVCEGERIVEAKLTDFGVARSADADATMTQTGFVTGSPAYLSPELASGGEVAPASDVWSLGATLFHAVTGRPPYEVEDNVLGVLYRIVHEDPPQTDRAGWLAPLLAGTMTRDPQRRWSLDRVRAFLAGEREAAGTRTMPALRTLSPTAPPRARRSRRRWLWPVLAVAVLVAAVVVALALSRPWAGHHGPRAVVPSRPRSTSATPGPTADGIRSFVSTYLATASKDPAQGFAMLTSDYQAASGGLNGYERFWGNVRAIRSVTDVAPTLDPLGVSYTYTYTLRGQGKRTENIHLTLVYSDGHYLIAGS